MLLIDDVLLRSLGCLALFPAHLDCVFGTLIPRLRSNLL
ncbi:hypothetical protein MGAST_19645 [Mycobacterium gastri 'Wayne']|nr:hypothetical protein MGAST_19645 [Mycobacterium gastri 'Wayne']